MDLPVMPPVKPMLAKPYPAAPDGDVLPPGEGMVFEPKWDGFRAIVFRDGDELVIGSRNERPLTRYFPELLEPLLTNLPLRCVIDGEVVIAGPDGLAFDALQQRIHPAESRVNRLAVETPASIVVFDLLAFDDRSLMDKPFFERRALLDQILADVDAPIHLTPATTERDLAKDWFVRFEGAGLDGVMAKPPGGTYQPDKRVQFKVKHKRTADCAVAGYRMHKSGDGVGSMLLGLYDDQAKLHHIGVASSFTAAKRKELHQFLTPYEDGALENHPWHDWAVVEAHEGQRLPGAASRWNASKDLTFTPLRVELVAEVAYENLLNGRLRHGARFQHWRADREPDSCTYSQLDQAAPYELKEIFGI